MFSSKETSIFGIATFLSVAASAVMALTDGNPDTNPDWNIVIAGFFSMLMGLRARDNNKSSKQLGLE